MGGGDHCYFFNAVATVDVLTERNNNVNFVETQIRFERIYKVDRDFSHSPWMPRDIAFIPSILKRVQRWQVSWIRSFVSKSLSPAP